ncbi:MAG: tetratricopeptide repeat protein [Candidatus Thorarchaeota archaeon]
MLQSKIYKISTFTLKEWQFVHSLIDRSEFSTALSFFTKARLPKVETAVIDDLYFMEAFIRLLIVQGYQVKALPIIAKVIERLYTIEQQYSSLMAKVLIYNAQCLMAVEDHPHVISIYQSAYNILENNHTNQSDFGQIYLGLSQLDESVKDWELYLENALECFKRVQNCVGEASALNAYGIYYGRLQDSGLALDFFQKAMEISQENHDLRRIAGCLNNQAVLIYLNDQNPNENKGFNLINEAINISKKIVSLEFLVQHHKALVQFYHNKNDNISAIPHLQTIYELQEKRGLLSENRKLKYQDLLFQKKPLLDNLSPIN